MTLLVTVILLVHNIQWVILGLSAWIKEYLTTSNTSDTQHYRKDALKLLFNFSESWKLWQCEIPKF